MHKALNQTFNWTEVHTSNDAVQSLYVANIRDSDIISSL